jgi:hypothetical protein
VLARHYAVLQLGDLRGDFALAAAGEYTPATIGLFPQEEFVSMTRDYAALAKAEVIAKTAGALGASDWD